MVVSSFRFLRVVGWVAVLAAVANPLADRLGVKYCQPGNQLFRVHEYLQLARGADVLFLGSSRTYRGIIPVELDAAMEAVGATGMAYDLGQPGTTVVASVILLRDLLMVAEPPPRIVVLEVSPGALNGNSRRLEQTLVRYSSPRDVVRAVTTGTQIRSALAGMLRGYGSLALATYRMVSVRDVPVSASVRRRGAGYGPAEANGACRSVSDWTASDRASYLRYLLTEYREKSLADYEVSGLPVAAVEEAVGLARRCGVRLVLLRYPAHPGYRMVFEHGEEQTYEAFIRGFARRHGLLYIELTEAIPEHEFADYLHLNACGARHFSRKLGELLAAVE